jgi:hypothetical protein
MNLWHRLRGFIHKVNPKEAITVASLVALAAALALANLRSWGMGGPGPGNGVASLPSTTASINPTEPILTSETVTASIRGSTRERRLRLSLSTAIEPTEDIPTEDQILELDEEIHLRARKRLRSLREAIDKKKAIHPHLALMSSAAQVTAEIEKVNRLIAARDRLQDALLAPDVNESHLGVLLSEMPSLGSESAVQGTEAMPPRQYEFIDDNRVSQAAIEGARVSAHTSGESKESTPTVSGVQASASDSAPSTPRGSAPSGLASYSLPAAPSQKDEPEPKEGPE